MALLDLLDESLELTLTTVIAYGEEKISIHAHGNKHPRCLSIRTITSPFDDGQTRNKAHNASTSKRSRLDAMNEFLDAAASEISRHGS